MKTFRHLWKLFFLLLFFAPLTAQDFDVDIPDQSFDEDNSMTLTLDNFVNSSNFPVDQLVWSFDCGPNLQLSYDSQNRTLGMQSTLPNWFGINKVGVLVTDPNNATATDSFWVTINSVNDAPVASLQSLTIDSNPDSNIFDLKQYVTDVDNLPWQLSWEFWGYTHFDIQWENQSGNIIRITALDTTSIESGFFRVFDFNGAADTVQVTLARNGISNLPFEIEVPNQAFDEDASLVLSMDTYVVTINNATPSQVAWTFSGGTNVNYNYDSGNRQLTLGAAANWFGQEDIIMTGTAPDQTSRRDTVTVTVQSVNDPPQIIIQSLSLSDNPDSNVIDLKPYASDADHTPVELDWTFSGYSNFDFQWVDQSQKIVRITPQNGVTSESGTFRVTDPAGDFFDATVTLNVDNSGGTFMVEIPPVNFDEDASKSIFMDTVVTISNYTPSSLNWSFIPGSNLQHSYDGSSRVLTIQSAQPDWFGSESLIAVATAPDQSTRSDTVAVNVQAVNDAPVATINNLFVSPSSNNQVDLKLYATDVDHDPAVLNWDFFGYSQFAIQWVDQAQRIIEIVPLAGATSETGTFRVSDPQGASDTRDVTITFNQNNTAPRLTLPAQIFIPEDSLTVVNLVDVVVDSTNSVGELTWQFTPGNNLNNEFDQSALTYTIRPVADWFGQTSVSVTVTDPDGLSDQQVVDIIVENRNDFQSVQFENTAEDQVTLTVQTELPTTLFLEFWTAGSGIMTLSSPTFQQQHILLIDGLMPNSSYNFNLTVTDQDGRRLTISDSTFSTSPQQQDQKIFVYPNPVKPSNGHDALVFANLPQETYRIGIYSLIGNKIFEEDPSPAQLAGYRIRLDDLGSNNVDLRSGMYIYMVQDEEMKVLMTGKVVVIR